jgi:hypothetical protein
MTDNAKPVAKSLHTITVIQQVYSYRLATNGGDEAEAMDFALQLLGLANRPDPYGLAAKALRLMPRN